ncbi:MAG: hypothetical protein A3F82_08400 [Deltaproteobacteria bacterium RIFCSPLOWO2_12_FULL_44_12]|nr:MAG: hypothetical protein A2712_06870 [Deltaproteobacteria bacterium RIFCSPHIGHO2_01_FULL_43_49]OGQ15671.1 MAG: hypothetical protein A3D22_05660 [Deltaproteobacteria bacterium RIFCSPHIGHO2_02_FULL_44_53]OGQ28640.1 MAG: hypothetical protein A3D98_00395 [Deltaproteobacteria bacterium RIFCSPHIGHO2_12_FULL_44_21]OGQ31962.1 MAG: hypothetical protein A2979_02600 [Deltaproteobacteria bacterium RIFCSPLOWO2_01_FULL_45_74]OGQ43577.1 MAG: hypothetical protein A3I70_03125 [Deltaproteobacteria bacterium 
MKAKIGLVVFAMLWLTHCGGLTGTGSSSNAGTEIGSSGVSLTSNDFSTVGVCSGSLDVTTTTIKNALAAATSFTFMEKTFTSDADNPFICGKQGTWDPSTAGAFATTNATVLFADLLTNIIQGTRGTIMMCNTGFDFTEVDYGFHDADTFRGELTFTDGTTTYRVRLRFTVTGTDAGKTLASLGLTLADISLTDGNDAALTTAQDILNLFAANPSSITIKVKAGGTTRITGTGGIICAKTT